MATVAFLGLGVMGYPMAGHLAQRGGHDVTVYNRTTSKAEKWVAEHGGKWASTPADAARDADFVFACVGNDDDLRSVTLGDDGAFSTMKAGAVFIDNTTVSADIARELYAEAKELGFDFLDAPVSGGQAGAENGQLGVMIGGDQAVFDRAKPVIDCFAKIADLIGPAGAGQTTKMVNQICIAGILQGLSEGLHLAQKSGLDVEKVVGVISQGAAGSWQMVNRHRTMDAGEYEHGFAIDWMRKDLGICLEEGDRLGMSLPVTALVDQYYADVQRMGGNRWDTSALLARLKKFDA
ncbi:MAG: NAD(P)-dependent oxidoreductase [Pseudomonadota bacterium]